MNDREIRIDRDASDAIKRMERQQLADGKLNKALAIEGGSVLFLPAVLAVVFIVGWVLTSVGLQGAELVLGGAAILVGLVLLVAYLGSR